MSEIGKNELLNLIRECGGDTAQVIDRTKKGIIKALMKTCAEQPSGGGGGDFVISGTLEDTETELLISDLDKTFEETMQAFKEGRSVKVMADAGTLLTFANAYSLGTSGVVALMFKLQIAPTVIVDGTWRETASDIVFALPS